MANEFCGAEYSYVACGGNGGFWGGGSFGGQVAEHNKDYAGLPRSVADAMRIYDQRAANAAGGLGFRTSAEILAAGRATSAHAWVFYDGVMYDWGGVVWGLYTTIYVDPVGPDNTTFRGVSFGLSSPVGIGGSVNVKVDNSGNIYVSGGPTFGVSPLVTANYFQGETKQNGVNVRDEASVRQGSKWPIRWSNISPIDWGF
jgi:hypothetical protein